MKGFSGIAATLTTTTLAGLAAAQAQELRPLVGAVCVWPIASTGPSRNRC